MGVLQLSLQELKAPLQWHPPQRALDAGTRTHGDEEAIVARFAYALALKRIVCGILRIALQLAFCVSDKWYSVTP